MTDEGDRDSGPLLSPSLLVSVPMRTLSDDLRNPPPEPDDASEPAEADEPGLVRRLQDRLARGRLPAS